MDTKKCSICKDVKPVTTFNRNKSKKGGLNTICRTCSNRKSREYYKNNTEKHKKEVRKRAKKHIKIAHAKMLEFLKKSKCADCGIKDFRVLEFDHLYDKKHNVSSMLHTGYSWLAIKKEIDKCEVVCANCHKIRTGETINSYKHRAHIKFLEEIDHDAE